jgi:hypothetical protein
MAKLTQIIPPQNFELIRDKIPVILTEEIGNQYTLQGNNPDLDVDVFSERTIPFDTASIPAINVLLSKGNSNFFTAVDGVYVYTFFIDVYTKAKSTDAGKGGSLSSRKLHKLLGTVRAILENPAYRTLDFPTPSLEHTAVTDIAISDPKNNQDTESVMMGRVTFMTYIRENTQLITPLPLAQSHTSVTLDETDKGYKYSYIKP